MKFVGIEPVGATLFPEKLAAFPDLVEIAKTNPACCRVSETTSLSTPVGLAISGMALEIAPKGAPVVPEVRSRLGAGWGKGEP